MSEFLTVVHECTDFSRWKSAFDADAANRRNAGLADLILARLTDKPNVIALVLGVSDVAKARAMAASAALRETMQQAGIIGAPDVHFRSGEFSPIRSPNYLSLNCRIRSIETFRKAYASDSNDRQNAGLTDRGLLLDMGDANDLLLLWAVEDVAKAKSFLSSPKLAEHQVKNAGVISEPLIRFWTAA